MVDWKMKQESTQESWSDDGQHLQADGREEATERMKPGGSRGGDQKKGGFPIRKCHVILCHVWS